MLILSNIRTSKNTLLRAVPATCILLAVSSLTFSQNKDSADHFLQKGLQEKQNGRRMESLKQFEKALKFDTTNQALFTELASAYMDLRKYYQARETYKKLEQLGDQSSTNYKHLLTLSYNLKQQDDVLLYADKLKKADPAEKVNFYIGKVHYDRENYGEAIKTLNEAVKEDPANAEAPYMIARSYADMLNYKQSIPYFQKAIALDSTKPYWIYEMALIYYGMNDSKNTLKYMLEAGNKGLTKGNDYLENLGIAYLDVGDLENGIKIMSEILKRKPSDINILNMVAEAYYYKGKYNDAIDYWDRILEYDKQSASALYMIGMSYQKKGDKEKGQLLCDKAIEMDPSLANLKQKKQMPGL
ncbi:MAG: tetratricopeptide repeat protein [Chitinophagaceae bacterium]|nr:tetratricopeptide repeat protein [Chitinophagaceae bacterium]